MSVQKAAKKAVPANGQDSIFKLLYAPFAFLSTGNEGALVDMLASAVGFLEGYSSETLEADAVFHRNEEGSVVARSQLKLVPYVQARSPSTFAAVVQPSLLPPQVSSPSVGSKKEHHTLLERSVTIEQRLAPTHVPPEPVTQQAVSTDELESLLQCFCSDSLDANRSFDTLLQETSSPAFTNLAVACYSQTGLTVPASSFKHVLSSLAHQDYQAAKKLALDYEFEMDLTSFVNKLPKDIPLVAPFRRSGPSLHASKATTGPTQVPGNTTPRRSRLDRVRNSHKKR